MKKIVTIAKQSRIRFLPEEYPEGLYTGFIHIVR